MLRLEQVQKSFDGGRSFAVDGVSVEVARGELLAIIGPSGCGKTTALKIMNRLVEPSAGRVFIDGKDILGEDAARLRRRIGYVIQRIGLFPHMTVAQNVSVVPRLLGWSEQQVQRRVDELLDLVDLPPARYGARLPHALSGGQQQRVGFARALAGRPQLVLMDEPFGAIDPLTRDGLQQAYLRIARALGVTTVMVTHDISEALIMGDRVAVMRAGRLVQVATPAALAAAPADDFVRELVETPRRQMEALRRALAEPGPGS